MLVFFAMLETFATESLLRLEKKTAGLAVLVGAVRCYELGLVLCGTGYPGLELGIFPLHLPHFGLQLSLKCFMTLATEHCIGSSRLA